jgi:hypothetical protein
LVSNLDGAIELAYWTDAMPDHFRCDLICLDCGGLRVLKHLTFFVSMDAAFVMNIKVEPRHGCGLSCMHHVHLG